MVSAPLGAPRPPPPGSRYVMHTGSLNSEFFFFGLWDCGGFPLCVNLPRTRFFLSHQRRRRGAGGKQERGQIAPSRTPPPSSAPPDAARVLGPAARLKVARPPPAARPLLCSLALEPGPLRHLLPLAVLPPRLQLLVVVVRAHGSRRASGRLLCARLRRPVRARHLREITRHVLAAPLEQLHLRGGSEKVRRGRPEEAAAPLEQLHQSRRERRVALGDEGVRHARPARPTAPRVGARGWGPRLSPARPARPARTVQRGARTRRWTARPVGGRGARYGEMGGDMGER